MKILIESKMHKFPFTNLSLLPKGTVPGLDSIYSQQRYDSSHLPPEQIRAQSISLAQNLPDFYLKQIAPGKSPMPGAPTVQIDDQHIVPSQFSVFRHTLESVRELIGKIKFDENFRFFVFPDPESPNQVLLQVGMVDYENYPYGSQQSCEFFYGRVWRVEKLLPSSEIIQTAFKAVSDMIEHESRELVRYKGRTIFNNHMDLPLFAIFASSQMYAKVQKAPPLETDQDIQNVLNNLQVFGCRLNLTDTVSLPNGRFLYQAKLIPEEHLQRQFPTLRSNNLTILAEDNSITQLLYGLMDAVILDRKRYIEETFSYDGIQRFSRKHTAQQLTAFSRLQRDQTSLHWEEGLPEDFDKTAAALNGAIKLSRRSVVEPGNPLDDSTMNYLSQFDIPENELPIGFENGDKND